MGYKVGFAAALIIYTPTLSLPLEARGRGRRPQRMGSTFARRSLNQLIWSPNRICSI